MKPMFKSIPFFAFCLSVFVLSCKKSDTSPTSSNGSSTTGGNSNGSNTNGTTTNGNFSSINTIYSGKVDEKSGFNNIYNYSICAMDLNTGKELVSLFKDPKDYNLNNNLSSINILCKMG